MIKSAVLPFHFWQPDFHTASPTAVSAMLSSVVVKLGVYGFLRMTTLLFVEQAASVQGLLVVLGLAGIVYGGLGALGTHNAKRMLAYSTLAQVGFILIGIGWGTALSITAVSCGTPTPATTRVVQIEPGPMPTLIESAPASISARVASAVATLPAITCTSCDSRFTRVTASPTLAE